VYPTLVGSYLLKMQQSIEAVLENLIFELPNKLKDNNKAKESKQFGQFKQLHRNQSAGGDRKKF
jgi:hypothetical protein